MGNEQIVLTYEGFLGLGKNKIPNETVTKSLDDANSGDIFALTMNKKDMFLLMRLEGIDQDNVYYQEMTYIYDAYTVTRKINGELVYLPSKMKKSGNITIHPDQYLDGLVVDEDSADRYGNTVKSMPIEEFEKRAIANLTVYVRKFQIEEEIRKKAKEEKIKNMKKLSNQSREERDLQATARVLKKKGFTYEQLGQAMKRLDSTYKETTD